MNRIAKFGKVSFEQFREDWYKAFGKLYGEELCDVKESKLIEDNIKDCYDNIELPQRATAGSAGYDFKLPFNIDIKFDEEILIPTGIRCEMEKGWVLKLYPRSGHGFKYGIRLANTVGIIDEDYAYADNEGHIMVKLLNESDTLAKNINLECGSAFCQGVFVPFGITVDDEAEVHRTGGFGSTDSNK